MRQVSDTALQTKLSQEVAWYLSKSHCNQPSFTDSSDLELAFSDGKDASEYSKPTRPEYKMIKDFLVSTDHCVLGQAICKAWILHMFLSDILSLQSNSNFKIPLFAPSGLAPTFCAYGTAPLSGQKCQNITILVHL